MPRPRKTEVLRALDAVKAPGLYDVLIDGMVVQRRAFVRISKKKLRSKRYPKTASVREMKAWQEATRVKARGAGDVARPGTLAADIEEYLKAVAAMRSFKDRQRDLYEWRRKFGDRPRASVTPAEIRAQLHEWLKHGPRSVPMKKSARGARRAVPGPLAASTVNHRRTALEHLFTVLDQGADPPRVNPVHYVQPFDEPPAEPRGRDVAVIRELFKVMPAGRTRAIAKVLFWGGIRGNSELSRMRPALVNLVAREVWVPTGKKGKPRLIVLNDEGVEAWREFLAVHAGRKDWKYSRGTLRMRLIYYARQLAIDGIRPYDLRHSIATALRKAGADLSDVAEHLGHTTLRMTKRYAPFQGEKLRSSVERL